MYPKLKNYLDELSVAFNSIPESRKQILEKLSDYIAKKRSEGGSINLVYICTHNSRRSHFGQIWAKVAANYYGVKQVNTYSGGTEATAFNANAINALKRAGFEIKNMEEGENPVYHVFHDDKEAPSICFSKTFDDAGNPQSNFAAIMTCSDAEENCPFIPGVDLRIATTYDDPKAFDHTPEQDAKYDERCKQIALETFYVFSKL
jgi:arsenate reductase (thioredoxin)